MTGIAVAMLTDPEGVGSDPRPPFGLQIHLTLPEREATREQQQFGAESQGAYDEC